MNELKARMNEKAYHDVRLIYKNAWWRAECRTCGKKGRDKGTVREAKASATFHQNNPNARMT